MDYQDFTIGIRSVEGGGFEAKVVEAPGQTEAQIKEIPPVLFSPPIPLEDLVVPRGAASRRKRAGESRESQEAKPRPKLRPRDMGERLYTALFCEELGNLFKICRSALDHSGSGLRIRLRFRLDDTELKYLSVLPWECLWDPHDRGFLAADRSTPVVRDFLRGPVKVPFGIDPPLRILVVDAAPSSRHALNLRREMLRIMEVLKPLKDAGQVELRALERNTPEGLRKALREEVIHILHFMGHGGYDPGSGYGAVFFEKPDGKEDKVGGVTLAGFLKDSPSLRLVVLNACETARHAGPPGRPDAPLYSGVASAILEKTDIPAVIANQHTISDVAAIAFSETFYSLIAEGVGVEEALTEVRFQLKRKSPEWATPVLFLAAQSGDLLDIKPTAKRATIPLESRFRPEEGPIRLGVQSFGFEEWGRDMDERNDRLLELERLFDNRFIRRREDWQEKVFPELRGFLLRFIDLGRPLVLDFAAHASIAFAAGWVLEVKSSLDVRVRQRTPGKMASEWHPEEGGVPEGLLWREVPDIELDPNAPDVAVALAVTHETVAEEVRDFIQRKNLKVGRIIAATVPKPGQGAVLGGAHALRLTEALLPRLRQRYPHERNRRLHLFCAGPNALLFYLGQLSRPLGRIVLYEYAMGTADPYGRYQPSIELPPPGEAFEIPEDW